MSERIFVGVFPQGFPMRIAIVKNTETMPRWLSFRMARWN